MLPAPLNLISIAAAFIGALIIPLSSPYYPPPASGAAGTEGVIGGMVDGADDGIVMSLAGTCSDKITRYVHIY